MVPKPDGPRVALAASSGVNVVLGADYINEPFNCWTDGAFGLRNIAGTIYAMPSVNSSACEQFVWSGTDVDHLKPVAKMNGLTYNTHTDRGRIYDKEGWWPYNIYVDTSTNPATWWSYMHTEDGSQCDTGLAGVGTDLRSIGVWKSTDQGANWTYQGVGLSLDSSKTFTAPNDNCNSEIGWPKVGGPGDHEFIVGQDGYLYLLYTQFTYDNPSGVPAGIAINHGNLGIARSSAADKGAPGTWYKYYNGGWTEAGQGGHETYLFSEYDLPLAENSQRALAWSTYLNKYVMAFARGGKGVYLTYSADLLNWTDPELVYKEVAKSTTFGDQANFIAYMNLVDIGTGANGTSDSIGRTAWLYYVLGNQSYEVHRRLLSFDNQTNLAASAPVGASVNYGFGSKRNLTDGDLSTYFQPDVRTDVDVSAGSVYVDLGAQTAFNKIRLFPYTRWGFGFPVDFSFEGANSSGGPWTSISSYMGYTQPSAGETQTFGVGSQSYRYVRLSWSRLSNTGEAQAPFSIRLAEFQVFNDTQGDPPTPTPPSASSTTYLASTGFSGTQGTNLWYYMYLSPLDPNGTWAQWVPMTYNVGGGKWEKAGTYAAITSNTQHPDYSGGVVIDSARTWRAPADGVVHITGTVRKQDTTGGNGVRARIMLNRTKIWPTSADWQTIAYNDSTGYSIDIYQQVRAADRLLFIVNADGNVSYDNTSWDPSVDYKIVSSTYSSYTGYSSTQGANQWSYQYYNGSTYTNLTWDSPSSTWIRSGTYTIVGKDRQHPDANSDSVRVWTAPSAGTVSVSGWAKKGDIRGGDGTRIRVLKNGTQVWPVSGWTSIGATDAYGVPSNFSTTVASGDKLYFSVNYNADATYDTTIWPVSVTLH